MQIHTFPRRFLLVVTLVSLTGVMVAALPWANRAFAQQLVATSSLLAADVAVEPGQARHYFYEVYTRLPETIPDPPDPYHLPTTTFLAANQTTEVWQTQIGDDPAFHSITRAQTGSGDNQVLYEIITRVDEQWFYSAGAGLAFQTSVEDVTAARETQAMRRAEDAARIDRSSTIAGVMSLDGRLVWIVQFQQRPATPQEYAFTGDVSNTAPFGADLDFSAVQTRWLIDQADGIVVREELWALTAPEPILLSRTTRSAPAVIAADETTIPMDRFMTAEAQTALAMNRSVNSAANQDQNIRYTGVDEIATQAPFRIYVLPPAAFAEMAKGAVATTIYHSVSPCALQGPEYEFEICAGNDDTVSIRYVFEQVEQAGQGDKTANTDEPPAITITQGEKESVVQHLQKALPSWLESEPAQVSVLGRSLPAWRIPFFARVPYRSGAILFEIDETFVQVTGYGVSMDTLMRATEQLQLATSTDSSSQSPSNIYLPLVTDTAILKLSEQDRGDGNGELWAG